MKLRQRKAMKVKPPRAYFIIHRDARDEERLLPNVKADVDAPTVTREEEPEDTYSRGLATEEGAAP